ncbi:hypothetical protein LTV02_12390 [Nocardia yamanashiensis]|uniref:hypothetical protein n=1 Tax=Nocardia yamanashiensis TaxID=209247 RepID=UPI001E39DCAA|nr:hypothetical protein [Nocardia yamanashiensis]UGT44131.1 hypothetical protein LTV02_12390 [Nocardia yamanashiensis]
MLSIKRFTAGAVTAAAAALTISTGQAGAAIVLEPSPSASDPGAPAARPTADGVPWIQTGSACIVRSFLPPGILDDSQLRC